MPNQPAQILRFRVGVVRLALDAAVVRRIVPFPHGLVRLDRARHHCGVFHDEGVLVSVIDLRVVLGQQERGVERPPVVIIETGGRHFGFLVDAVDGLIPAGRGQPASLPRPLPTGLFRRTWLFDGDLVLELDPGRIVQAQPLASGWHEPFFPAAASREGQGEAPKSAREAPKRTAAGTPRRAEETSGPSAPPAPFSSVHAARPRKGGKADAASVNRNGEPQGGKAVNTGCTEIRSCTP